MRSARVAVVFVTALAASASCAPIEGRPISTAPSNDCTQTGCEAYSALEGAPAFSRFLCNTGRCVAGSVLPSYVTAVVVDVPDTSFYAPGRTFVLSRDDLVPPAGTPVPPRCVPPRCVQLPVLVQGVGRYRVSAQAATDVAYPAVLPDGTSIPVRATFERLLESTGDTLAASRGIPVDTFFTSSLAIRRPGADVDVAYSNAFAVGRYQRVLYPQPPYDAYFPPVHTTLPVSDRFTDEISLGDAKTPLDDPVGEFRVAKVSRIEGLDGYKVWLADRRTQRRISPVKSPTGASAQVRLDTVGERETPSLPALRREVDMVIAPPAGAIAVPLLRSGLIFPAGTGEIDAIQYPALPEPVAVSGIVALDSGGVQFGVPSRVIFHATEIKKKDQSAAKFLEYDTSVSTDSSGRFATVLPPGVYEVVVEPAEGTGRAKQRVEQSLEITSTRLDLQLRPVTMRTKLTGRVKLTDKRDVSGAEVSANPLPANAKGDVVPRPARARTAEDGTFAMELDQGPYDIVVDPEPGTGFPRIVGSRNVQTPTMTLPLLQIPPPVRLQITFRDPNAVLAGNPIVQAVVRVYATREGNPAQLVEIGRSMTDEDGLCEILLAQQPH